MRKFALILLSLFLIGCSLNNADEIHVNKKDDLNDGKEVGHVSAKKIKIDPNFDHVNENNESDLLAAVHNNDVNEALRLINLGANVNLQDKIQDSPYLYAGAQGRTEILEYMLKYADIDFSVVNRFGGNTLIPAAEKGHVDNVKLLVADDRIDLDFQNNFGYTALIEAVALTDGSEVFVEIVKILVDSGADTSIHDNYGKTALDYAISLGYTEIESLLK